MKKDDVPKRISYESDGKMGNPEKTKNTREQRKDFFNTTQNSE